MQADSGYVDGEFRVSGTVEDRGGDDLLVAPRDV